jgi:hypothetical protein
VEQIRWFTTRPNNDLALVASADVTADHSRQLAAIAADKPGHW